MKKLIPVAFFALLALNSSAIKASNTTTTPTAPATEIPAEKRANETTDINKEGDSSENAINSENTKTNDSSTLALKDNAGIYISSGAALIIIVILLIILL